MYILHSSRVCIVVTSDAVDIDRARYKCVPQTAFNIYRDRLKKCALNRIHSLLNTMIQTIVQNNQECMPHQNVFQQISKNNCFHNLIIPIQATVPYFLLTPNTQLVFLYDTFFATCTLRDLYIAVSAVPNQAAQMHIPGLSCVGCI